jgi:hypothetical protein
MRVVIKIADLSDPSSYVCPRVKYWFRKHGLSWEDFKRDGIALEVLHATNDQRGMIDRLEATARRRMAREAS